MPSAEPENWHRITAGQRVQVIKPDKDKGGVLQFGTEVITAADGSIAGLLGASPGASTAVPIMLGCCTEVLPGPLGRAGRTTSARWCRPTGRTSATTPELADETLERTAKVLGLHH